METIKCKVCGKEYKVEKYETSIETAKRKNMYLFEITELKTLGKAKFFVCKNCWKAIKKLFMEV